MTGRASLHEHGLVALERWIAGAKGATDEDAMRIAYALATVRILSGKKTTSRDCVTGDGECAGPLFKGPVCPVCLCCRACSGAYDYAPGGKKTGGPCPGCNDGRRDISSALARKKTTTKKARRS